MPRLTRRVFAATVAAGLLVGAVNWLLARLVVGRRLRLLADRMGASRATASATRVRTPAAAT